VLERRSTTHLLGEVCGGVLWHFSWWNGLQLGFDLIILGEVSGKSAFLFMLWMFVVKFTCFISRIMKLFV
jgi:hypothetical protein